MRRSSEDTSLREIKTSCELMSSTHLPAARITQEITRSPIHLPMALNLGRRAVMIAISIRLGFPIGLWVCTVRTCWDGFGDVGLIGSVDGDHLLPVGSCVRLGAHGEGVVQFAERC